MQSRCCWPPERPSARRLEPVLHLVPERRAAQRSSRHARRAPARSRAVDPQAVGDVVEDRLRERVRLLEDHADPAPQVDDVDAGLVDVACRPAGRSPRRARPGMMSFIRFRQRRNVDLPQPDGPMNAVTDFAGISERDVVERLVLPVAEVQVRGLHPDRGGERRARGRPRLRGRRRRHDDAAPGFGSLGVRTDSVMTGASSPAAASRRGREPRRGERRPRRARARRPRPDGASPRRAIWRRCRSGRSARRSAGRGDVDQ